MAFREATIYCAPAVAEYLDGTAHLHADALRCGVAAGDVDRAIGALRQPQQWLPNVTKLNR